jgi:uncharacterized protein (TIGR00296 family)
MNLSIEDGKFLVKLAREAIKAYVLYRQRLRLPSDTPENLLKESGVFVTLKTYPRKDLRGCIGYPEPIMPLAEAVINCAIASATEDPRFPPLAPSELDSVVVEVTVLTPPVPIDCEPDELPKVIKVGRDGLIVRCMGLAGLLLPQVPVEWGWNEVEFLSHTCMKAGLPPDCWKNKNCKFYKFEGKIFSEVSPNGEVVEE